MNSTDLQIWNNAVFDNGGRESQDSSPFKPSSWCEIKPDVVNRSSSLESDLSFKENRSPVIVKSLISVNSPAQIKTVHPNGATGNSKIKAIKGDEKKIDAEIEEIEKEMNRLSSRLQVLKSEKAEHAMKISDRRGILVPASFLEKEENVKKSENSKKIGENLLMSGKAKIQKRGVSIGWEEICANGRRGLSLGPSEIVAGAKFRQMGKPEIIPVQSTKSRPKSGFWKLQEINEEKVSKERGKSVSPKSRKVLFVTQGQRNAATTIGSRNSLKKDEEILAAIQPRKLFKDVEKSVTAKKPMKPGRIVASRYNQTPTQSAMRKRSLPETDKDESKRCDKKRASLVAKAQGILPEFCGNQGSESRVKKRWEIPSEIVVCSDLEAENSPSSISVVHDLLPRIRTSRLAANTPRDSGPAKRLAELEGKKSFFCIDEDMEEPVCQALSFAEEEELEFYEN